MKFPGCQSVLSNISSAQADIHLPDYDCIQFGSWRLYSLFTPGHTGVSSSHAVPFFRSFLRYVASSGLYLLCLG
jgi:hypothetical protein